METPKLIQRVKNRCQELPEQTACRLLMKRKERNLAKIRKMETEIDALVTLNYKLDADLAVYRQILQQHARASLLIFNQRRPGETRCESNQSDQVRVRNVDD